MNTAKIRELNDLARTAMGITSRVVQTQGIWALDERDQSAIRERIELFGTANPNIPEDEIIRDPFTEDNDPYGEHDFGMFVHDCVDGDTIKVMWKIDYYDKALKYGSEDPSDPRQTTRVLTIMLASEY